MYHINLLKQIVHTLTNSLMKRSRVSCIKMIGFVVCVRFIEYFTEFGLLAVEIVLLCVL